MAGLIGKTIGGLLALVLAPSALLFLLVTLWPGERMVLHCIDDDPTVGEFGFMYERYPAWARLWAEDDGTVWVEPKAGIYLFFHVDEDSTQIIFSSEFGGRDSGRFSKINSRVAVMLSDGRGTWSGKCEAAPDTGLN